VTAISRDEIYTKLSAYIQEQFLDDSEISELKPDTPLLEWGVLNSMNTSILLTYIRTELGVTIPPTHITGRHFYSIETITDMVYELSLQPA
jgi:acyl carrier protein